MRSPGAATGTGIISGFVVSPEDAAELTDLKAYTRDLVAEMERDLGTRLDWVALDHWNTDNPHTRLLVRGKGEDEPADQHAPKLTILADPAFRVWAKVDDAALRLCRHPLERPVEPDPALGIDLSGQPRADLVLRLRAELDRGEILCPRPHSPANVLAMDDQVAACSGWRRWVSRAPPARPGGHLRSKRSLCCAPRPNAAISSRR